MWNGKGDFFCKDLSCNISNTDPSWAYTGMITKVQYFVVNGSTGPQRLFCPTIGKLDKAMHKCPFKGLEHQWLKWK